MNDKPLADVIPQVKTVRKMSFISEKQEIIDQQQSQIYGELTKLDAEETKVHEEISTHITFKLTLNMFIDFKNRMSILQRKKKGYKCTYGAIFKAGIQALEKMSTEEYGEYISNNGSKSNV